MSEIAAPTAPSPSRGGRPHPRLDSYKRTWYFLRRNTLALFGLGVLVFFVIVAIYATTQPLPYYSLTGYCATNYTNPTVISTEGNTLTVGNGLGNGSYAYTVTGSDGYLPVPSHGTFQVKGTAITI